MVAEPAFGVPPTRSVPPCTNTAPFTSSDGDDPPIFENSDILIPTAPDSLAPAPTKNL